MKTLTELHCPECQSLKNDPFKKYNTVHNGERILLKCDECDNVFSETAGTPMQDIKSPISKVASVLKIRSEGMGLRATGRVLGMHKNTVSTWERLFGDQKETLMLYSFCHEFVSLVFEGDELYTVVGRRTDAHASEGWTAVIMERSSRFIVDQRCGAKDAALFESVMSTVCEYISQTGDLSFFSDGERRYGNTLFAFCAEALRNGKPGRPPKTLPKGLKLRVKNKGDQKHKRGPKRKKYQAPLREHPETDQELDESNIHANHVEANNAAMRRRNSAFRRRTNTYAKTVLGLQRTLDVYWVIHNFVRKHWTTGEVPAVAMGVLSAPLGLEDILMMQK
ncbi:IS1 family transposase [Candidatus Electrothrix sp.]|uniref:IS1 family transposase n=1 Tax=Candidatus Electrothrix sp. TaxID=2170559 RepID=UPI00405625CB